MLPCLNYHELLRTVCPDAPLFKLPWTFKNCLSLYRGAAKAAACMIERTNLFFRYVPDSNWEMGHTSCLRFTGKLSFIKGPSQKRPRKFLSFQPLNLWRNKSRVYTRRWLFSPARQARLVPASAGDNGCRRMVSILKFCYGFNSKCKLKHKFCKIKKIHSIMGHPFQPVKKLAS